MAFKAQLCQSGVVGEELTPRLPTHRAGGPPKTSEGLTPRLPMHRAEGLPKTSEGLTPQLL
eukprot:5359204-Alexandrium_andersonii.AAC.2